MAEAFCIYLEDVPFDLRFMSSIELHIASLAIEESDQVYTSQSGSTSTFGHGQCKLSCFQDTVLFQVDSALMRVSYVAGSFRVSLSSAMAAIIDRNMLVVSFSRLSAAVHFVIESIFLHCKLCFLNFHRVLI